MRTLFLFIAFFFLFNLQGNARFQYDTKKVSAIRWTPFPSSVSGLNDIKIDLNGTWQFNTSPGKDFFLNKKQSGWKTIEVPGEWVMQGYTVKSGEYAGYARSFKIPSNWKGKRIVLKCEAIYSECKIWLNSRFAGEHLGGMTPFEIDITSLVRSGENNISIAVRSESLADTLSGASTYAVHPLGGISRPICLIVLPEVNIASFHVSTTFDPDYKDATLKTDMKIANETACEQKAVLKLTLRDASGKITSAVGNSNRRISLSPNTVTREIIDLTVSRPKKWDPEHPKLY